MVRLNTALVEILFHSFLWTNTGNIESFFQIQRDGGGHLHQTAHLVIMMVNGFGLFPRPVASTAIATTTVTGFAQFVSSPLQSLNLRNSTNVR